MCRTLAASSSLDTAPVTGSLDLSCVCREIGLFVSWCCLRDDVLGLCGRRPGVALVRVMQGCDDRSVRALVTDPRVLDRGFHDVTIVDMEDTAKPAVSEADLSLLRL